MTKASRGASGLVGHQAEWGKCSWGKTLWTCKTHKQQWHSQPSNWSPRQLRKRGWTLPHCSMHPMCSRTCELVESVAPYPKTSTEELNQWCHKRCPRGVPEAKQSCLHDLFGFFYRCRCHEHVSLLNLLHRIPEELSQSGCHKRCPRGVPEASEGGVEPTEGGGGVKEWLGRTR